MAHTFPNDEAAMRRALELAGRGLGYVEPNPPVGAVIVDKHRNLIAEGFHERFGGPHAEVNALVAAGDRARGQTMFVTLEPCCHTGKTGPCSRAVIEAGIKRVVVAMRDPAPHVDGGGLSELEAAGLEVVVGLCEREARELTAPFVTLISEKRPWVHAKWAMTLDGKIASRTGHSQWISGAESRQVVHELRGRMDAVIVGAGTAAADDPQLTARPPGPRTATRIVIDSGAMLSLESKLVATAREVPVLVFAGEKAGAERVAALQAARVEVIQLPVDGASHLDPAAVLEVLGRRQMTNVLIEGGGGLLGSFFDRDLIDEAHVFVAPKLVGGKDAIDPVGGEGLATIPSKSQFRDFSIKQTGDDVYLHGQRSRDWIGGPVTAAD
ncbi:Riboflavin biosynthesis protein RibD [Stratiformator vulcanicus]|uniref:Riboflavin biosynthesis protein RibD n=2 Tax=Stratiformator vulcanicus TaxID=2527980 RepID=A0A517R4P6_9PLAN|nr:Riboflavin biosynthesis protein RibD [Stratiformator vulcanicus]